MSSLPLTVADRVRAIIAESLGVDAQRVLYQAQLNSDLGSDSLDVVELVMAVGEEFEIVIPDWDYDEKNLQIDEHSTVAHVIAVVERLVAAKAGA